jgi:hypothetical protein
MIVSLIESLYLVAPGNMGPAGFELLGRAPEPPRSSIST